MTRSTSLYGCSQGVGKVVELAADLRRPVPQHPLTGTCRATKAPIARRRSGRTPSGGHPQSTRAAATSVSSQPVCPGQAGNHRLCRPPERTGGAACGASNEIRVSQGRRPAGRAPGVPPAARPRAVSTPWRRRPARINRIYALVKLRSTATPTIRMIKSLTAQVDSNRLRQPEISADRRLHEDCALRRRHGIEYPASGLQQRRKQAEAIACTPTNDRSTWPFNLRSVS
jgi:hypothetical protein